MLDEICHQAVWARFVLAENVASGSASWKYGFGASLRVPDLCQSSTADQPCYGLPATKQSARVSLQFRTSASDGGVLMAALRLAA
jgi:hypothetical protein